MTRRRKLPSPPPPEPPDFEEGWNWIPTEDREERKRLARIVARKGRGLVSYRAFQRELADACREATWRLYERQRGGSGTVRAILEARLETALAFHRALATPAHDADAALDKAMARDARDSPKGAFAWRLIEGPPDGLFAPRLEERADWLGKAVADYARWARAALADLPEPRRGRPSDDLAKRLVHRLGDLWRAQTGKAPTVGGHPETREKSGDFLQFCREIIEPIWRSRGLGPPGIEDLVRDYRYPRG
jgi:hypothetical protein